MFTRLSGVLLHPSSLPNRFGIGDLGESAYRFIDFLDRADQGLWQILPLGPTGYGDSPYQCFSAFAGNPLLVSPDLMFWDGYLPEGALSDAQVPPFPSDKVDFGWVIYWKEALFETAFDYFKAEGSAEKKAAFDTFCKERSWWLDDYAFFTALKKVHVEQDGGVWTSWPAELRDRDPSAMTRWRDTLAKEIELEQFKQYLFFDQWLRLKAYANGKGIKIVGDMPIFVAFDSADVWVNRDLFFLDEEGNPTVIAGVPPDYFSETGQRWGNPLYRWDVMAEKDYGWWSQRLESTFELVDILRIDHFRGFEAYWEIPAENETAIEGDWVKGPGLKFFKRLKEKLGELPIIAEDLGVITEEVVALREGARFPGMKILQFAFGGEQNSAFLPHSFEKDAVVYTGSHDNETTVGWYRNASDPERDHVRRYAAVDGSDIAWDLIRLAHQSVAVMSVIPMQDLMSLDNRARMNFPGKVGGYWTWRYMTEMLNDGISDRLKDLTQVYGRSRNA